MTFSSYGSSVHRVRVSLLAGSVLVFSALIVGVSGSAVDRAVTIEPDAGTLSGNAKIVTDDRATNGKYISFDATNTPAPSGGGSSGGSGSTGGSNSGGSSGGGSQSGGGSTTPPAPSGYPQANNTGYPHGLSGDTRTPVTLTPYSGPCVITAAGTVIDKKDITCRIEIRAANVTIKNSRIRVSNTNAIYVNDAYHLTVLDTELDGQGADNSAGGISLIGDGSYTLVRVDAHSSGDIARANWGGVAIVDSWLHDPACLQASCHNDVIQTTDGDCTVGVDGINGTVPNSSDTTGGNWCIKIVHNRLENPHTQTSNILLKADQGSIHHVLVENNLFNGGGYTFYWYDSGYQVSNATVRNNHFRRAAGGGYWPNGGYYGPVASNVGDSSRYPIWSNNIWDDNGASISF